MKNSNNHVVGGRVVKWKGRVASIAPALASVSVIALMTTGALGQTVFDSTVNGEQVISIDEDVTITFDGRIRVFGGNDPAPLYIDVGGISADYSSVVINNGEIDLLQNTATSAAGIWLDGNLNGGSIINSGDVTVDLLNDDDSASAAGIYVSGNVAGAITNSSTGLIDVLVASYSYEVTAYGIQIGGSVGEAGVITNAGVLNVEANVDTDSDAFAYGIYVGGDLDGAIDNSGTIDVLAASGTETGFAYGIYVSGDVGSTGSIENSGDLLVEGRASTSSSAYAYGMYVGGDLYGSITNTASGMIDVYAQAGTDTASAYGLYIDGNVEDGASIVNDGIIEVEAYVPVSSSTAYAYGIYVGSDMNGTIDNTGTIDVYAESATSSALAYGIYVGAIANGSITNAGDIIVEAFSSTSTAEAYGIFVDYLEGSITNSGLIDAYAHSVTDDASAYGIYVGNSMNGTITNTESGVITVTASTPADGPDAYGVFIDGAMNVGSGIVNEGLIEARAEVLEDSSASASGIYVDGALNGTIENSGDILASAVATSSSANAYGIEIVSDLNGSITNSGTITATAYSTNSTAEAYGISIDGALNGTIDSSGTISATATSETVDADAYGIYVGGGVGADGMIDVSGLIEATAETTSDTASAYGIYVSGDMDGTITVSGTINAAAQNDSSLNSAYAAGIYSSNVGGTIMVTSTGVLDVFAENYSSSDASAAGIYVAGNVSGTIDNHGLITVEAYSSGFAEAYGISVDGTVNGSITNSGTIDVYARSSSSSAQAYGIYAASVGVDGAVTNSGYIDVYAGEPSDSDFAAGVYLDDMAGNFTNTGSIVASDNSNLGAAIYIDGAGGLVTLNTSGFIEGNIVLDGDVNLNVQGDRGRSVNWTVDASGATDYAYVINGEGYRGTTVFEGEGSYVGRFATFDSSGIAAVRQAGADAGFIGLDALLSQTRNASKPASVTSGNGGADNFVPFVAGATKSASYGGSGSMLDQDVTTSSLSFGGTMAMNSGLSFGLAAGTVMGSTTVDYIDGPASETDQQGAFIGLAMGGTTGNLNFAGTISGGRLQFDSTRYVNDNTVLGGIVTEGSSFDSTFMAARVAVSGRFEMGNRMSLVPSTSLQYARHNVDGYVETGTDGAADVGQQSFGVLEGEIGGAVEKSMGSGVLSGGISMMSRSINGGENVLVSMIDDADSVDATIGSASAAKLSLGYSSGFLETGQFSVGVESLVGSNGMSGGKISGEIRFSF